MEVERVIMTNAFARDTHRQLLEWFEQGNFQQVQMRNLPVQDRSEPDYEVCLETKFSPSGPWQLSADVWFTTDGYIGLGIGSYGSLANWLGIETNRHGFLAGFEPTRINADQLIFLIRTCALGLPRLCWPRATRWLTPAQLVIDPKDIRRVGDIDFKIFKQARLRFSKGRSSHRQFVAWS